MARGMPQHAKQLTELLQEQQALTTAQTSWSSSAGQFFGSVLTDNNMTQKDLATELGISQPYLNQILRGKRTPSSEALNKLRTFVEGEPHGNTDKDQK